MEKFGLQEGHDGAAGVDSIVQMDNMYAITSSVFSHGHKLNSNLTMTRHIKNSNVPGGICEFRLSRAGEALFSVNGVPVLFVTRLSSEKGADANVGKWYRKQWYFENYLKVKNPQCNHVTFVYASGTSGMLQTLVDGLSMVMSGKQTGRLNMGSNSLFSYDTDTQTTSWDVMESILKECIGNILKPKDLFTD